MKTQQGKFIIVFDVLEFAAWLDALACSRVIRLLQCHHTYIPNYASVHGTNHFDLGLTAAIWGGSTWLPHEGALPKGLCPSAPVLVRGIGVG